MTELKDYEKDVLEAIRTSRENGDTTITIKIHFNDKEADKISKSVTEIETKLKSTLDVLSTHAQDIEEKADTCDCECDEKKNAEMEFEEHDSWPDTYDEMLADIYEHFDDQLTDIRAEISEIHHNVDLMTRAIPQSFGLLEKRLDVAPWIKIKKKPANAILDQLNNLNDAIKDTRNKMIADDFHKSMDQISDIYKMLLISKGNDDELAKKIDTIPSAAESSKAIQVVLKDIYARQDALEEKIDKIITMLQHKEPAKKPATKKPAPKSDPNE